MVQIVLLIPRMAGVGPPPLTVSDLQPLSALPFVPGECSIEGYEQLIVIESVQWETSVEAVTAPNGRRTVHSPKLSTIKLRRRIDLATANLTQSVMTGRVAQYPWQLYFLKAIGGVDRGSDLDGHMQARFLTVTLHNPLITSYNFEAGDSDGVEELEVSATMVEWLYEKVNDDQTIAGRRSLSFDIQQGVLT